MAISLTRQECTSGRQMLPTVHTDPVTLAACDPGARKEDKNKCSSSSSRLTSVPEQLIQNQLFDRSVRKFHPTQGDRYSPERSADGVWMSSAP